MDSPAVAFLITLVTSNWLLDGLSKCKNCRFVHISIYPYLSSAYMGYANDPWCFRPTFNGLCQKYWPTYSKQMAGANSSCLSWHRLPPIFCKLSVLLHVHTFGVAVQVWTSGSLRFGTQTIDSRGRISSMNAVHLMGPMWKHSSH